MAHSILIVDDHLETIRRLETALDAFDAAFVLTRVFSGEEALLEARLSQVDLLVTSDRLPGMSGFELLNRIRILRPQVRTILMSAQDQLAVRDTARQAGAEIFLSKPVSIREFAGAVEQILGVPAPAHPGFVSDAAQDGEPDHRVSDRLSELREALDAGSVLMVDDSGEILFRAGSLPNADIEKRVLPSLMAAFSAGERISHFLGRREGENAYFFQGEPYTLIMVPFGGAYALVTAMRRSGESAEESLYVQIKATCRELLGILANIGVPVSSSEEIPAPPFNVEEDQLAADEAGEVDEALESLFEESGDVALNEDPDAFWETPEEQSGIGAVSADALSYEQAVQLGLAPDEEA